MGQDIPRYFDLARLPPGLETTFGDPSKFSKEATVGWLDFLLGCQTGTVPSPQRFQFALIPAGPTPIHPSESQETSREQITISGSTIWMLRFMETVTKCHQVGGMVYEQAALDYADFVSTGLAYANTVCAPPERWLGLPMAGPNVPKYVMSDTELEGLSALASLLPESQADRLTGLLDALNAHQSQIPASVRQVTCFYT